MVTNNFRNILFGGIMGSTTTTEGTPTFGAITIKNSNNTNNNISASQYKESQTGYTCNSFLNALNNIGKSDDSPNKCYIKVGTGTTEATADDYNIETELSGVTCDSAIASTSSNITKTYTATFTNTTASDANISELGLFIRNYNGNSYLIDRTVLSTPITIPAGQSKAITYEIEL